MRDKYRKKLSPRKRRHVRVRAKVSGTAERPRLNVFRSSAHIYAQVIDDERGLTIVSASTTEKDLRGNSGGNLDAAKRVGQVIAERALARGIEQVVFDRGGYLYHGRVKALADAARAAGLNKHEVVAEPEPPLAHPLLAREDAGVHEHQPPEPLRLLDGDAQPDRAAPVVRHQRESARAGVLRAR